MWQRHARTLRHFHASVPRRKQDSFPDVNLSWEWLKTPAHPRMQRFLTVPSPFARFAHPVPT